MKRFTIIWLLFTPLVFWLSFMSRGSLNLGGEVIYPIVPLLVYAFEEMKEDLKTW